ncbi:hypothetical protein AK812_SmicGene48947, partial [Symbiodinium microadriaticum]
MCSLALLRPDGDQAISKLERLGYPREEIVRQLKDPQSHLCSLTKR